MNSINEKEKKLNTALDELKNLDLSNPNLRNNIENLNSQKTQLEIEKLLGMGHVMFKHLLALNTYTEPFLSMRANDQRAMIEQLLGITMLSEKAAVLKELLNQEDYR